MTQFMVEAVAEVVLGIVATLLIHFLSVRIARPPAVQGGFTVYSVNRFWKYWLLFGGITLCGFLLCLVTFVALRDGVQRWGTAFFAMLLVVFGVIFFKALQEISNSYEVQGECLSVIERRRRTSYGLRDLEIIGEKQDGLLLKDSGGHDILVSAHVDGYTELRRHILNFVRDDR